MLNTNISSVYKFTDEKELSSNTMEINMERDVRKGKGLQYIRSVIISDYDICVINRHLFL